MKGPKDTDRNIDQNLVEIDKESSVNEITNISIDEWGNEWDDTGDFNDMDFRLVDD